jgi:hypothetical protein
MLRQPLAAPAARCIISILTLTACLLFPAAAGDLAPVTTAKVEGVLDQSGKEIDPLGDKNARAVVLIFISIDCPISNRYAPEVQRLHERFSKRGVKFWLVQPARDETLEATRKYLAEYRYSFGLLRDTRHALVKLTGVTVTPEAAVFAPGGKLVYRGRIDDRYVDFGKARPAPVQRELNAVLEQLLDTREITITNTPAVGCSIAK